MPTHTRAAGKSITDMVKHNETLTEQTVRDPRCLTAYVAAQIMNCLTQAVYSDTFGDRFSLLHEVVCHDKRKLGYYRVCVEYNHNDSEANITRVSHIFDLQMLMDMRGEWEHYVEQKVLTLMQNLAKGTTND